MTIYNGPFRNVPRLSYAEWMRATEEGRMPEVRADYERKIAALNAVAGPVLERARHDILVYGQSWVRLAL